MHEFPQLLDHLLPGPGHSPLSARHIVETSVAGRVSVIIVTDFRLQLRQAAPKKLLADWWISPT